MVQTWEQVSEELVQKAWIVSGYTETNTLEEDNVSEELVVYSDYELGSFGGKYAVLERRA